MLRRFKRDQQGASEIVGTALFLVILFFFFTNVFLWHDQATREMDQVIADRMNSGIKVERVIRESDSRVELAVKKLGGLDVTLSRLWIVNSTQTPGSGDDHWFADLEPYSIHVGAGSSKTLLFEDDGYVNSDVDGEVGVSVVRDFVIVHYAPPNGTWLEFRVLTKRANTASYTYHSSLEP